MTDEPTGRESWLLAGQEVLRRGGAAAVKLHAVAEELGLTTGSFYHYFDGMSDYLEQLARYYGSEQARQNVALLDDLDPRARLRHLDEISQDDRMQPLDAAMRDWAGSNKIAADSVREADERVLRVIARAFCDLGFEQKEAQLRARLLLAAGVARISSPWRGPRPSIDDVLDILAT
jgi:AcrR family transcriptional regulator